MNLTLAYDLIYLFYFTLNIINYSSVNKN